MTESLVFKERTIVSHSEQEILSIVRDVILEVMDEDEDEITILMDTSFQDDLELESIELIAMGDLLGTQFGPSLQFAQWLSQLTLDQLTTLTVGDLVRWIRQCLTSVAAK